MGSYVRSPRMTTGSREPWKSIWAIKKSVSVWLFCNSWSFCWNFWSQRTFKSELSGMEDLYWHGNFAHSCRMTCVKALDFDRIYNNMTIHLCSGAEFIWNWITVHCDMSSRFTSLWKAFRSQHHDGMVWGVHCKIVRAVCWSYCKTRSWRYQLSKPSTFMITIIQVHLAKVI